MFVTLCSLVIALFLAYLTSLAVDFDAFHLAIIILVGGTSVFLSAIFIFTTALIPLARMEQTLIPNLMHFVRHDKRLAFGRIYLFLFSLVSFICVAFVSRIVEANYHDWFFLVWIVLFGLSLDVLRDCWTRLIHFLNPSYVVNYISESAVNAIRNDKDPLLLYNLDSLAEIALHSVENSKLSLSAQSLKAFPPIMQSIFAASKSIGHIYRDAEIQASGKDEASYSIFYLLQRLELINDRALRDRMETVCRQMIMTMGKIIVHCAHYDLSTVSFPVHFLTKFGLKAYQHHFEEVGVLTTSTLLEISKTILTDVDVTYAELQGPFRSIINGLDALAKATFKKRKDTSIKVLAQPFLDLKALFQTEKMSHHQDTPAIIREIDRVLEEFNILEQVMQTMPPIPNVGPEETSG